MAVLTAVMNLVKKYIKSALFIFALLMSVNAAANVTVQGEVARLYPSGNAVHFKLKNDQCGNTGQYYYFPLGTEVEKAWYAMLLAAATTGKPVKVSIPGCPATAYVLVRYIYQDY